MKDSYVLMIILAGIIGALALGLYFTDKGIEREGTVIGTYVWDGNTKCIILVDSIRYNSYCQNVIGDKVKIIIYQNGQATMHYD